jgi:hypothetical protein
MWSTLKAHIKETLRLNLWSENYLRTGVEELIMLREWDIHSHPEYIGSFRRRVEIVNSPEKWQRPLVGSFKLNFDRASKGNPGPEGFGGAIRNHPGSIICVLWGYIGEATNNVAELNGLTEEICYALRRQWTTIIIEGDLKLVFTMADRIQKGSNADKVAHNWWLDV